MKGPLLDTFNKSREGDIKEELTQYRIKDGMLTKVVVNRNYFNNCEDYIDDITYIPICEVKE